jgi:hypothetical protein
MTYLTVNTEFTSARHRATLARTADEHVTFVEQYRDTVGELGSGRS